MTFRVTSKMPTTGSFTALYKYKNSKFGPGQVWSKPFLWDCGTLYFYDDVSQNFISYCRWFFEDEIIDKQYIVEDKNQPELKVISINSAINK